MCPLVGKWASRTCRSRCGGSLSDRWCSGLTPGVPSSVSLPSSPGGGDCEGAGDDGEEGTINGGGRGVGVRGVGVPAGKVVVGNGAGESELAGGVGVMAGMAA